MPCVKANDTDSATVVQVSRSRYEIENPSQDTLKTSLRNDEAAEGDRSGHYQFIPSYTPAPSSQKNPVVVEGQRGIGFQTADTPHLGFGNENTVAPPDVPTVGALPAQTTVDGNIFSEFYETEFGFHRATAEYQSFQPAESSHLRKSTIPNSPSLCNSATKKGLLGLFSEQYDPTPYLGQEGHFFHDASPTSLQSFGFSEPHTPLNSGFQVRCGLFIPSY